MKQLGTSINPGNAQEFLDSTKANHQGQMQFLTPPGFALACMTALQYSSHSFDPQCGAGHLLEATQSHTKRIHQPNTHERLLNDQVLIGCDIDARAARPDKATGSWSIAAKIDFPKLYPLLMDMGFTHPQILANPPFSLRWKVADLRTALDGKYEELIEVLDQHTDKDGTCDSTLWTILATVTMLQSTGEAMIICNANTARRFCYDAHGNHNALAEYIWLWLEVDAVVFPNIQSAFATAVLYISASHGLNSANPPHKVVIQTAEQSEIIRTLTPIKDFKYKYHRGHTSTNYNSRDIIGEFKAAVEEYQVRHAGRKQPYNISLDAGGRIRINLSTYARTKFTRTEFEQLRKLSSLQNAHPAQLVVQVPTRRAMLAAAHGNIWTVDPLALTAIDKACVEYNSVRAPFFRPSPVQCLAYLDEEDTVTCTKSGLPGIHAGDVLTLSTYTEKVKTPSHKFNLAGEREDITLHAQELVCQVTATDGKKHTFHVHRPDDATEYQHDIPTLIEHFHIPIPQDIAELNQDQQAKHLATLDQIEALVNA